MVFSQVVRNADDFGLDHRTNILICDAWKQGMVDTISIMVNTEGFDEALKLLSTEMVSTKMGLHLSLTTPWRSYRKFICELLMGMITDTEIHLLIEKQIRKAIDCKLPITRVDSHHGVHFFPKVWNILIPLINNYGIKYVRNPPREFCWFHPNLKIWISKNKSWFFYQVNKGGESLPYEEIICHPGKEL